MKSSCKIFKDKRRKLIKSFKVWWKRWIPSPTSLAFFLFSEDLGTAQVNNFVDYILIFIRMLFQEMRNIFMNYFKYYITKFTNIQPLYTSYNLPAECTWLFWSDPLCYTLFLFFYCNTRPNLNAVIQWKCQPITFFFDLPLIPGVIYFLQCHIFPYNVHNF